jgi:hypothetical protein
MLDNEKTTNQSQSSTSSKNATVEPLVSEEVPDLDDVLKVHYSTGTVFRPNLKLKPIMFDTPNAGVKQLDVSVIGINTSIEPALKMINDKVLDKK